MLAALGSYEREELLASLGSGIAADAAEQIQAGDGTVLLSETGPDRAAQLLAAMEPREALRTLRRLPSRDQCGLLDRMPPQAQLELGSVLAYPGDQAGGVMTVVLARAHPGESVDRARRRLSGQGGFRTGIGSVAVVDESGRVAGDVPVFDLLLSEGGKARGRPDRPRKSAGDRSSRCPLSAVTAKFVQSRQSSLLVVNDEGCLLGRIAPSDVPPALAPACAASWSRASSPPRRSERPYGGHPHLP